MVRFRSVIAEILMTLRLGGGGGDLKSFSCQTQLLNWVGVVTILKIVLKQRNHHSTPMQIRVNATENITFMIFHIIARFPHICLVRYCSTWCFTLVSINTMDCAIKQTIVKNKDFARFKEHQHQEGDKNGESSLQNN